MMKAQLALDAGASLGEAALWHDGHLLWVDIDNHLVNRFDPVAGTNRSWNVGQMVGTVVPRQRGGWVLGLHNGVSFFDPSTGELSLFADPAGSRPEMRCNDGKCDPHGRLFVGTIGINKPRPLGCLYRIHPDLHVSVALEGTGTANGLAWSADRQTMYFVDTPTREVSGFDYDEATGAISGRRPVVRFSEKERGRPDGMTIDAEGRLWVALYDGGAVVCCDPGSGKILERIEVPVSRTTSCAFGGEDLSDLYITTGRAESEPGSGGLFVVRSGAAGVPAFAFAG